MSTAAQATPSNTISDAPSTTGRTSTAVAVGVSLAVLAIICLGVLAYFYGFRPHRKRRQDLESRRRETVVEPGHMASRVTPFYPFTGEGPRFGHTPGENMRVAHRREDGGWEFSAPSVVHAPVTPFLLGDASSSVCPSPTTSVFTTFSTSKKEKKSPGELTTRGFVDPELPEMAPPAYTRNPSAPITPRTSMGDF